VPGCRGDPGRRAEASVAQRGRRTLRRPLCACPMKVGPWWLAPSPTGGSWPGPDSFGEDATAGGAGRAELARHRRGQRRGVRFPELTVGRVLEAAGSAGGGAVPPGCDGRLTLSESLMVWSWIERRSNGVGVCLGPGCDLRACIVWRLGAGLLWGTIGDRHCRTRRLPPKPTLSLFSAAIPRRRPPGCWEARHAQTPSWPTPAPSR
jgi:hypothetical protein